MITAASPTLLHRTTLATLLALLPCVAFAAKSAAPDSVDADAGKQDLYFGEALFQAYQGHWFEALQRLDTELAEHDRVDEKPLDSLYPLMGDAEFKVGDFELNYRMHHRAGRAISHVLEADVPDPVRNEAAFRLARIQFQKGQAQDAMESLKRIHGDVPDGIRDDIEFLRANVYLDMGQPAEAAAVLKKLQGAKSLEGFAAYNYGIALLQSGKQADGREQLAKAGTPKSGDASAVIAIRDKANMVLGRLMLEAKAFGDAQKYFDRVSLDGPYSNQALLSSGWAAASANAYERALVPWKILAARDPTDSAVQEAKLALPYAYAKLKLYGRAAVLYDEALDAFGGQLGKLDASEDSVRNGTFLKALVREEVKTDERWVVNLRKLPGAPETFYLTTLMASHDFQTALQNYLDLEDLRRKLEAWQTGFDAFDSVIAGRRSYYEPLLPGVDAKFRELDAQYKLRLEQRANLRRKLDAQLTHPQPQLLASADERIALNHINAIETAAQRLPQEQRDAYVVRAERLRGAIAWTLRTEYADRLTQAFDDLAKLDADIRTVQASYTGFVRARQASVHGYVGYDDTIRGLRSRVGVSLEKVEDLQKRQGELIEKVAVAELDARIERLKGYQDQARYDVADSYDRANQAQDAPPAKDGKGADAPSTSGKPADDAGGKDAGKQP